MDLSGDFHRPSIAPEVREAAAKTVGRHQLQVPRLPQDNASTYEPGSDGGGRVDQWCRSIIEVLVEGHGRNGGCVVLDSSHQGSGKSYAVPDLAIEWMFADDFNPGELMYRNVSDGWDNDLGGPVHGADVRRSCNGTTGFIYVSKNFRSPSIAAISRKFEEIPTRHQGLLAVPAPEGGTILRTITQQELKDGVIPDEPATCAYAHRLHSLASRGFAYKDATESFCKDRCPYRPVSRDEDSGAVTGGGDGSCIHRHNTSAFWEGHKGMTEPVPMSTSIRCSVQALEGLLCLCPDFISKSLIFFDESDQLLDAALKTHNLSKKKLGDLISFLPAQFMVRPRFGHSHPDDLLETFEQERRDNNAKAQRFTEQLLTQLLQLLEQIKAPHGIDHHQVRHHLADWIAEVLQEYGRGDDIQLPDQWQLDSDAHLTQASDFEKAITSDQPDSIDSLPTPLLPRLIHCVLGADAGDQFVNYSLSVTKARSGSEGAEANNYRITLTSPSGLLPAVAEGSAAVLVGDATADADLIKQMFTKPGGEIAFRHIKAAPVQKADQADVQFFQVKDLGAMCARERREHQTKRLEAIRSGARHWAARILAGSSDLERIHQIALALKVGFIDHKLCARPGDGKWFTASARGGNMFQDYDVLVLVGKPLKNVSAALSEYVSLTGDSHASTGCTPEENSPGFIKYQAQLMAAELQQAWERLRIIRRKGQRLIVLFVSDADLSGLPIDVLQIKAEDITPQAAHKTDQKLKAITEAVLELAAEGLPPEKISIGKTAKRSGVSRSRTDCIGRHQVDGRPWIEFVLSLVDAP